MTQQDGRGDGPRNDTEHDEHGGVTIEVIERVEEGGRAIRKKGIYLLPNLITTAALFFGFSAIVAAMNGKWERAAVMVFVAGIMDGLDGRVARLTRTQSPFGAQYDSLSDCVAFGVAPALVMFAWALDELGRFGWAAAFVYAACAALRLARFNVQLETADKRWFTGLPSPAAAAVVAGMVWVMNDYGVTVERPLAVLAAVITAGTGLLMVSNIKYHSFKELHFGRVPLWALLVCVLVIAVVNFDPPTILWGLALLFALSGPVLALFRSSNDKGAAGVS